MRPRPGVWYTSPMTVSLSPELRKYVEEQVRAGRFASAEEVVEAGLARLMLDPLPDALDGTVYRPGRRRVVVVVGLKAAEPRRPVRRGAGARDRRSAMSRAAPREPPLAETVTVPVLAGPPHGGGSAGQSARRSLRPRRRRYSAGKPGRTWGAAASPLSPRSLAPAYFRIPPRRAGVVTADGKQLRARPGWTLVLFLQGPSRAKIVDGRGPSTPAEECTWRR